MNSDMALTIAGNIKKYRKLCKMTQADVAEKLSLDTQYYSQLERGERNFTIEKIAILCEIFDVTPDKIIELKPKDKCDNEIRNNYVRSISAKLTALDIMQLKILDRFINEILPL